MAVPVMPESLWYMREVVLQGDGGEGLRGGFDLDAFLCLDCLVQAVGVASALHDAAVCSSTIFTLLSSTTYSWSFMKSV